jgi:hypothetical protein
VLVVQPASADSALRAPLRIRHSAGGPKPFDRDGNVLHQAVSSLTLSISMHGSRQEKFIGQDFGSK